MVPLRPGIDFPAIVVVDSELLLGVVLCLSDSLDDISVEPFMLDGLVEALNVAILLGLTRLDVQDGMIRPSFA
jgi:hypothetical protein